MYEYVYDGLNRLLLADATMSSDPLTTLPVGAGDVTYSYDRSGNLLSLDRFDLAGNISDNWDYKYDLGTNKLESVGETSGNYNPIRNYTYDQNGNLLTDNFRLISNMNYGRSNLPFATITVNSDNTEIFNNYLYSVNDKRIYKIANTQSGGGEFYLRDQSGMELGIFKLGTQSTDNRWEWYVNSTKRVMKYKPTDEQSEIIDPYVISNWGDVDLQDEVNLRIITGIQSSLAAGFEMPHILKSYRLVGDSTIYYILSGHLDSLVANDSLFQLADVNTMFLLENDSSLIPMFSESTSGRFALVSIAEIANESDVIPLYPSSIFTADQYYAPWNFHTNTTLVSLQREYYEYDYLGNTRVTYTPNIESSINTQYQLRNVYDYDPFGKILRTFSDGSSEKFLTTQHERDTETGLDYRFARLYDSDLGRFLGRDGMTESHFDYTPYHYTFNNPIRFIDPFGLDTIDASNAENMQKGDVVLIDDEQCSKYIPNIDPVEINASKTSNNANTTDQKENTIRQIESDNIVERNKVTEAMVATLMLSTATIEFPPLAGAIFVVGSAYVTGTILADLAHRTLEFAAEHTKGARPSTKGVHEKGKARKQRDRGKEKADEGRRYPNKRPGNWT